MRENLCCYRKIKVNGGAKKSLANLNIKKNLSSLFLNSQCYYSPKGGYIVENATLFLRLGLPSTGIRQENGAFRKHSSNWRNLKMAAFRFSVDRKHWDNWALPEQCTSFDFSARVSPLKHESIMCSDHCVFLFLWRSVDRKHLMCFRMKPSTSDSSSVAWTGVRLEVKT